MSKQNILYFEGAGMFGTGGALGNCRIRTAFKTTNGKSYYLEIIGFEPSKRQIKANPDFKEIPVVGFVDFCFEITGDHNDCNKHRLPIERSIHFPYTEKGILRVVNDEIGANFNTIKILPALSGYRVHADYNKYNLMNDFVYDPVATKLAESIEKYHYKLEKNNGEQFPCVCVWRDDESGRTLRVKHPKKGYPNEVYRLDGKSCWHLIARYTN